MAERPSSLVEPRASRPYVPGYGVPETTQGMLPWSEVSERLRQAANYWICTVRPDGRPHAIPIWGLWVDGRIYLGGSPTTRWSRNLEANPSIAVHLESGDNVVSVEGVAEEVQLIEPPLMEQLDTLSMEKYSYKTSANIKQEGDAYHPDRGLWAVRPLIVFAWTKFPKDMTRFQFGEA